MWGENGGKNLLFFGGIIFEVSRVRDFRVCFRVWNSAGRRWCL